MTTIAVQCYAPGLLVFSLLKVLIPVFYAHQDMKTPVRVGIACTGLNMGLKVVLILAWQVWPFAYAYAGIAAATVFSSAVAVITMGILAHRRLGSCGWHSMAMAGGRMLAASLLMAAAALAAYEFLRHTELTADLGGFIQQLVAVLGAMAVGALTYWLAAAMFRFRELAEFQDAIRRRKK